MVVLTSTLAEEVVMYCAAWAIVLGRHSGDGEADEVSVSFGCSIGDTQDKLHTLSLAFSAEKQVGDFLREVKKKVKTLAFSQSPARLQPFPSTLSVGSSAKPSHGGIAGAVNVSCTAGTITADGDQRNARIEVLLAHLERAVLQLRSPAPATPLRDIDIFGAVDLKHLLRWNQDPPPCVEETLCERFARQAALRPSAPAVCSWDRDLSYAELDGLSAKLAVELVRRGVGIQQRVALLFDKSALAVIAMLAVLRAGACFVHLGISMPTQRQAAILEAADAVLLVVDARNSAHLADHRAVPGLLISHASVAALPPPATPLPAVAPHYAAAVQFTSGSTGTPKGIVLEHAAIATSCDGMARAVNIGPDTRIFQFASYTFDASVGDIFYALSCGGCICSPSEQERVDDVAAAARRMQATWAFLTPSVLSLLQPRDIPSLRTLLLGGERPSPKHTALWAQSINVHAVMGPSECAIYCASSEPLRPDQPSSTFGRARGCRLWVVDSQDHTKLAPAGCPGELVVEGRTVARGYLHDAERTRNAFLEEVDVPWLPPQLPASSAPRRLYKAGDIVRFHVEDGTLSFIARKDNQVKLHGQRVELEEIEHHLKDAVPDVDSAIALLNTSATHTSRHPLIAFVVFAKASTAVQHADGLSTLLTSHGINILRTARTRLSTFLPPYMIPTLFIPLQSIPFTLNGKRDVVKLREVAQHLSHDELQSYSLSRESQVTTPLSPEEEKLRDLWALVLDIDPSEISSDSDFIRQGGDSLAAMQLVTAATKVDLHLPVSVTMAHPRLSDMASKMSLLSAQVQEQTPHPFSLLPTAIVLSDLKTRCAALCKVDTDQIDDIYPITPIQEMLLNASLRRPGTYILRLTFKLPASTLLETFVSAWDQVVRSVDVLRTRIIPDPDTGGFLQIVFKTFEGWDFYENMQEYESQNDYTTMGPGSRLARLAIIRNTPSKTPIFVFAAHHAIYDEFSLTLFFDRVAELCQTGKCGPLTPFKNYVAYTRRLPLPPTISFWRSTLEGSPAAVWPPVPRETNRGNTIIRQHVPLPIRPVEFTLAIFAQTAFTLLFSAQNSSDDVVFGMSFSGRDAALQNVISTAGPTLITIPFRARLDRNISLGNFLDEVRQAILKRAQHGHIGLPAIRTASPDAEKACAFRALFAVHPRHLEAPREIFGERLSLDEEMGRLALIFECFITDGGIDLVVEFNQGSLDKGEMDRFVQTFAVLLPKLIETPFDARVGDVSLGEVETGSGKM
ncbi:acetyl-CoA synthetase-like protein [Massarina eburnea CBS 473.64]|uniref:Acetyl-CoA synthetase-like protein n=1 Tax=Massarina eburnea CBS 473.64 TaxID=1395130 RepID=A0A6A6RGU2_9PLEO|nr:acetyl-CoA synthetase-like protein [Massarina eburnea CBS 473.64]